MIVALSNKDVVRLLSLEFVKAWRWGAKWEHTNMSVVAQTDCVPFSLRDAQCQVIEPLEMDQTFCQRAFADGSHVEPGCRQQGACRQHNNGVQ